jgi:hypothetical protein
MIRFDGVDIGIVVRWWSMGKSSLLFAAAVGLLLAAPSGTAIASDISISAEISRASIAYDEKDTLVVTLTWVGGPFQYLVDDFPMPTLEKFEILGSSSQVTSRPEPSRPEGEMTTRTFRYILSATDYGTGIINPLDLTATNRTTNEKQELRTGRLTVEIARPLPLERKSSPMKTIVFVGGAVFVLGIAGFIITRQRAARRRAAEAVPQEKPYVDALTDIKKETVADGKLFYSRLYRLLMQFLEKERDLAVSGKTGEEVLVLIGQLSDAQEKAALGGWLARAVEVKYRPDPPPPAEIEDTFAAAKRFFESNVYKQ